MKKISHTPKTQLTDNEAVSLTNRMQLTDSQSVKKFINHIKEMRKDESFILEFNNKTYEFRCFNDSEYKFERFNYYSIRKAEGFTYQSMNMLSLTNKYLTFYHYNLFNIKNTFKMPINDIIVIF